MRTSSFWRIKVFLFTFMFQNLQLIVNTIQHIFNLSIQIRNAIMQLSSLIFQNFVLLIFILYILCFYN